MQTPDTTAAHRAARARAVDGHALALLRSRLSLGDRTADAQAAGGRRATGWTRRRRRACPWSTRIETQVGCFSLPRLPRFFDRRPAVAARFPHSRRSWGRTSRCNVLSARRGRAPTLAPTSARRRTLIAHPRPPNPDSPSTTQDAPNAKLKLCARPLIPSLSPQSNPTSRPGDARPPAALSERKSDRPPTKRSEGARRDRGRVTHRRCFHGGRGVRVSASSHSAARAPARARAWALPQALNSVYPAALRGDECAHLRLCGVAALRALGAPRGSGAVRSGRAIECSCPPARSFRFLVIPSPLVSGRVVRRSSLSPSSMPRMGLYCGQCARRTAAASTVSVSRAAGRFSVLNVRLALQPEPQSDAAPLRLALLRGITDDHPHPAGLARTTTPMTPREPAAQAAPGRLHPRGAPASRPVRELPPSRASSRPPGGSRLGGLPRAVDVRRESVWPRLRATRARVRAGSRWSYAPRRGAGVDYQSDR